ncbi:MAG: hypothetical protein ACRCZP_07720 [Phycicoccus sp.]
MYDLTLRVDGRVDPVAVTVDGRDIVYWEGVTGGRLADLQDPAKMTMSTMYRLAYSAARRTGAYSGDYDGFCLDVQVEAEAAPAGNGSGEQGSGVAPSPAWPSS